MFITLFPEWCTSSRLGQGAQGIGWSKSTTLYLISGLGHCKGSSPIFYQLRQPWQERKMTYMCTIDTAHPLFRAISVFSVFSVHNGNLTTSKIFVSSMDTFLLLTPLEGPLWKQGRTDLLMLSLPFYLGVFLE